MSSNTTFERFTVARLKLGAKGRVNGLRAIQHGPFRCAAGESLAEFKSGCELSGLGRSHARGSLREFRSLATGECS